MCRAYIGLQNVLTNHPVKKKLKIGPHLAKLGLLSNIKIVAYFFGTRCISPHVSIFVSVPGHFVSRALLYLWFCRPICCQPTATIGTYCYQSSAVVFTTVSTFSMTASRQSRTIRGPPSFHGALPVAAPEISSSRGTIGALWSLTGHTSLWHWDRDRACKSGSVFFQTRVSSFRVCHYSLTCRLCGMR